MPETANIFKQALRQCAQEEVELLVKKADLDNITFSDNFKRKMNALFREVGIAHVPHPEVETEMA